jgi:hypothetical protein
VGANYRAACRGRSKAEFAAKLGIVEEEADESAFWIEIIIEAGMLEEHKVKPLLREANEIVAMMVASRRTVGSPCNQKSKIKNQKSHESNLATARHRHQLARPRGRVRAVVAGPGQHSGPTRPPTASASSSSSASPVLCMTLFQAVNYQRIGKLSWAFYVFSLLLVLYTVIGSTRGGPDPIPFVHRVNGAYNWIKIGQHRRAACRAGQARASSSCWRATCASATTTARSKGCSRRSGWRWRRWC